MYPKRAFACDLCETSQIVKTVGAGLKSNIMVVTTHEIKGYYGGGF